MDITKLKKVIQEANPNFIISVVDMTIDQLKDIAGDIGYFDTQEYIKDKPITLHDIRLALIKNSDDWGDCLREVSAMWNEIDNLDEQSDICKNLLIRILVK